MSSTRRAARGSRAGRGTTGSARRGDDGRGRLWRWRRPLFLLGLMVVLGIAGLAYLFTQVPLPDAEPPLLQTTFICDAHVSSGCTADNSIAQLSGSEDRVTVTYDQLPPVLIDAVISAEDRDFFEHRGVDPVGIARALWANIRNESVQQGGSTITQQYVKNVYLTQERTLTRKVKEAALAVKVERELSKEEILTRYLNVIYFGRGAYGVQAASRSYFGKNVEELTLPEAAYLAGLIRSPETADAQLLFFDPRQPEQRATAEQRRRSVLEAMAEEGFITEAERDAAAASSWDSVLARPLTANNYGIVASPELGTEYFIDYVKHWLVTSGEFTDAEIYGGGLRVYTTLDFDMQRAAVDAITSTLNRPDDPAAALVALDGQGRVKAMVGGLDYEKSRVNLAVGTDGGGSGRQPGSSFKPIILAEALKQGMPLDKVYDAPAKKVFPKANAGTDWEVGNYADAGLGRLNLIDATRKSSNTAYAQMILDVGVDNAAALAKRMGITADVPAYPSIVLGTSSVSVLDMASAYSTFADNGEHVDPVVVSRVTDAQGAVLYEAPNDRDRVLSEDVAQGVNWALHQVVESGTGTGAKFGQPSAGKTGTTDDYRDAWFAGYTCSLTSAVWMGYPGTETKYMRNVHGVQVTGGTFPATIWRKFMTEATRDLPSCPFEKPARAPATTDTFVPGTSRPSGTTVPPSSTTSAPASDAPPASPPPSPPPTQPSTSTTQPSSSTTSAPP